MTGHSSAVRLLKRFLRDRLGVVVLVAVIAGVLLSLGALLLAYSGYTAAEVSGDLVYGGLLTATLLALYLGFDLWRWWPFARELEERHNSSPDFAALSNLPPGGTPEQESVRASLVEMHRRALAEVERHQAAFARHQAFMNLWVHQMKTPVAAISLMAQQIREQGPDELASAMADVDEETIRLTDGLDLVLNMARLSDFAVDYQIRRVDLLNLVRDVINGRKKQFIRLGVYPQIVSPDSAVMVLTDQKWNGFIIDQIVANALKYGAQSGMPDQRITFTIWRDGDHVVLTVADRGPGIPPADLPRVYEPFFTGENGRRFAQATGIGLYLVKQVAEKLGHQIAIESEVGRGTAVTLTYLADL